jgi:hypothetical protein
MTEETTTKIQDARDALRRWCGEVPATEPWHLGERSPFYELTPVLYANGVYVMQDGDSGVGAGAYEDSDARLIVGLSGNPAFIAVLDSMLAEAQRSGLGGWLGHYALHFAMAILKADAEMNKS